MCKRMIASVLMLGLVMVPFSIATAGCSCSASAAAATPTSGSGGCSGGGGGGGVQPCSPGAQEENQYGRIAGQQKGPQQPVAWGIYPTDPVGAYQVTTDVDGQIYDKKNQAYPPHGSVVYDASNKRYLQSGGIFQITGTLTPPGRKRRGVLLPMHARVRFILERLNADFGSAGLGEVTHMLDPEPGWAGPVWAFEGSQTACGYDDVESAIATLAASFQDEVIGERHEAWPMVGGRPLFASAESGVACWCLDGKPWCAIGQLGGALDAASALP